MAKTYKKVVITAASKESLLRILREEYYYSPSIELHEDGENKWQVHNSKGPLKSGFFVVAEKGKYKLVEPLN